MLQIFSQLFAKKVVFWAKRGRFAYYSYYSLVGAASSRHPSRTTFLPEGQSGDAPPTMVTILQYSFAVPGNRYSSTRYVVLQYQLPETVEVLRFVIPRNSARRVLQITFDGFLTTYKKKAPAFYKTGALDL